MIYPIDSTNNDRQYKTVFFETFGCQMNKLDAELFAIIDPDDHFDFQVRRPIVELDSTGIRSITWPRTAAWGCSSPMVR